MKKGKFVKKIEGIADKIPVKWLTRIRRVLVALTIIGFLCGFAHKQEALAFLSMTLPFMWMGLTRTLTRRLEQTTENKGDDDNE